MSYRDIASDELAMICADANNEEAWREFVQRCQHPIALVILRICRQWSEKSTTLVDDLVQDTFLRLCANECRLLRTFRPQHSDSVLSYVRLIAASVAQDHFRTQMRAKRGGQFRNVTFEDHMHSLGSNRFEQDMAMNLQISEIEVVLNSSPPEIVSAKDKTIFWLYFQQGFTCQAISTIAVLGLTVKGVESSIHRTTLLVRSRLASAADPQVSDLAKGFPRLSTFSEEAP